MRHFSLFDNPDEEPIKKVSDLGDSNLYFTINVDMSGLMGLFDIITWANRTGITDPSQYQSILEHLDQTYNGGPNERQLYTVRLNGDEFMALRDMYHQFDEIAMEDEFDEGGEHEDLHPVDIFEAEDALMKAIQEPSSGAGLENIPTMNTNPGEEPLKGNCPQCGVDAVDPAVRQCENCGWDEDNACPECFNDNSVYLEEDGSMHCNSCGWNNAANQPGVPPPATPAGREETRQDPLEQQFNLPSAEHPLGPHTGSERSDIYGTWQKFDNKWLVQVEVGEGQEPPQSGDTINVRSGSSTAKPMVLTNLISEENIPSHWGGQQNGIYFWEAKDRYSRYAENQLEDFDNQELYTSGRFVKGADGRWLVAIQPSGGQRDPQPGDWAQIIQRTKSFNRPVPLTLVEDMGGAWTFRNGHHPSIESQVSDENETV